jgi:protein TonB
MKLLLILLVLNCFQSISQIADPPNIELPEVLINPMELPEIFTFGHCPATYPGGIDSLKYYFQDFAKFIPENWADSNFNKRGYIVFVVESDGKLTNIQVHRGISEEADLLMIQLVQNMPNWIPACDQYGPVRSRARLPITFSLPD